MVYSLPTTKSWTDLGKYTPISGNKINIWYWLIISHMAAGDVIVSKDAMTDAELPAATAVCVVATELSTSSDTASVSHVSMPS